MDECSSFCVSMLVFISREIKANVFSLAKIENQQKQKNIKKKKMGKRTVLPLKKKNVYTCTRINTSIIHLVFMHPIYVCRYNFFLFFFCFRFLTFNSLNRIFPMKFIVFNNGKLVAVNRLNSNCNLTNCQPFNVCHWMIQLYLNHFISMIRNRQKRDADQWTFSLSEFSFGFVHDS